MKCLFIRLTANVLRASNLDAYFRLAEVRTTPPRLTAGAPGAKSEGDAIVGIVETRGRLK